MREKCTCWLSWPIWVNTLILSEKSPLPEKKSRVEDLILVIYTQIYPPSTREQVVSRVSMVRLHRFPFWQCLTMISPILFLILLDISLKVKSSLIVNCTISKSILLLMCYLLYHVSWNPLLVSMSTERSWPELITLKFQMNSTPLMPSVKIPLPWRPSSVRKHSTKKITFILNSWRDSNRNIFHRYFYIILKPCLLTNLFSF